MNSMKVCVVALVVFCVSATISPLKAEEIVNCGDGCPVVYIVLQRGSESNAGLGVVVYKNLVMTLAHVIGNEPYPAITVSFETQRSIGRGYVVTSSREAPGKVVAVDRPGDLAIIAVDTGDIKPPSIGLNELNVGDNASWYLPPYIPPLENYPFIRKTKGRVLETVKEKTFGNGIVTAAVKASGLGLHRGSGGPVFNAKSEVIGMVIAAPRGTEAAIYFVPAANMWRFLDEYLESLK